MKVIGERAGKEEKKKKTAGGGKKHGKTKLGDGGH